MDVLYEQRTCTEAQGLGHSYRSAAWLFCGARALLTGMVDVVGFYFLDLARDYTPPEDLVRFLADGTPPIYIGYTSLILCQRSLY